MNNLLNHLDIVDSRLQSKINVSIIFDYLRENSPISRAEISRSLKISKPTVSRIIDRLIEENYVIETEKKKTLSGKRPIQLKVNPNKGYVIGIDLGKERIMTAISNFNGEIIKNHKGFILSNDIDLSKKMIDEIKKIINEYKREKNIKQFDIKAICIGVPARIDINTRKIIDSVVYENWKDLNLKEILSKEFNISVYIENDVILSALGEKFYGEGKKYRNLIFIELSKGIGAGIISNNQLFRGSNGTAGEIAYTRLIAPKPGSKKIDNFYLEEYASIENIKTKAIQEISKGRKTIISEMVKNNINKIKPSLVCNAALKGDKLAKDIIREIVDYLSNAIINLILIQNPQAIVLGGDICALPEIQKLFVGPIIQKIKNSIPFKIPKIVLSKLGEEVGVIGASHQAVESLIMVEFPYKVKI